jgi:hypothetical protein
MSASLVFHQDLLDFIHQGLSITAASRDPRFIPSISKALACRVLTDTQDVQIFVDATQARRVLADVASCQRIAVTYCLPSSHKTIQIKGVAAKQLQPQPGDLDYTRRYIQRISADLESMGYPSAIIARYLHLDPEQLTLISFKPDSVFEQSPGEKAGEPMELG